MSLISPERFQRHPDSERSTVRSFVRGAAQGFDGNPAPMVVLPTDEALAHDLRMISEDVMRALRQVATWRLPRFEEQERND